MIAAEVTMMRLLSPVLLVVLVGLSARARADEPKVVQTTLVVVAHSHGGYARQPSKPNLRSWTPGIQFTVTGPIEPGSQLVAEFFDGKKPWVSINLQTPELAAGAAADVVGGRNEVPEEQAIIGTGRYAFDIRLKNELTGGDVVLFKGTFAVDKFAGNPEQKKNGSYEYFVDQDFWLPYGALWLDANDPQAPTLRASVWLRGSFTPPNDVVYLLYEGKPICDSKSDERASGAAGPSFINSPGGESRTWHRAELSFNCARAFSTYPDDYGIHEPPFHLLDKHPGAYVVKVMRAGKVIRALAFTVGADGKIADPGLTARAKLGGHRMLVPIQVLAESEDGQKLDRDAWKAGIYGNPVAGFVAP
jgi:hypothetical protein